jgi:DedD protein
MARSTSDEEVQLKKRARRRLVGAVVLATAVAVVLPMVLDTEPEPVSQNVNIQIPSPDSPAYAPKAGAPAETGKDTAPAASEPVKPAPAQAEPKAALPPVAGLQAPEPPKAAEAPKAPEPPKAAPESPKVVEAPKAPAKEAAKPAAKEAAKPATKATPAKDHAKAAANAKFVVQIAALADTAKAKQLQQKVAGAGVKAYTEVVHTTKGSVTRVRAGPYDTREAAEKARDRLKGAGLDGKVVPR